MIKSAEAFFPFYFEGVRCVREQLSCTPSVSACDHNDSWMLDVSRGDDVLPLFSGNRPSPVS